MKMTVRFDIDAAPMTTPQKRRRWQSKPAILKKYNIDLSDGFQIIAEYKWLRGKITKFALILIRKKKTEDGYHAICRYDTAHGFAHLDRLDYRGRVIEKVAVPGITSYKTAYTYAKDDLQKNHKRYWQTYLDASPQERP